MTQATPSAIQPNRTSTGRAARDLVAHGALLLDVRTPDEFLDEHVPGALNVPLQELAAQIHRLGERARAVVVYCRSGRRSAEAADLLRQAGFLRVHDLGAMSEWGAR